MENDQPAICVNLQICFNYTGQGVPDNTGKLFPIYVFIWNAHIYKIMLLVFNE